MFCNARNRSGGRCRRYPLAGKRRCALHGGLSTGPRDWRPNVAAMVNGRKKYIEHCHALGLKAPGGRPRKLGKVATMVERAKTALIEQSAELRAAMPSDVMLRAVETLTPAEALGRSALSGLYQLIRIVEQPIDLADLKQQRLIADIALGTTKLFARAAEGEFRARRDDAVMQLIEKLAAEREGRGRTDGAAPLKAASASS